jgi:hypothetical protein
VFNWVVKPYRLIGRYRRFGETYWVFLGDFDIGTQNNIVVILNAVVTSSVNIGLSFLAPVFRREKTG